jgi:hypothetical protein
LYNDRLINGNRYGELKDFHIENQIYGFQYIVP